MPRLPAIGTSSRMIRFISPTDTFAAIASFPSKSASLLSRARHRPTETPVSQLFSPISLRNVTFENRLVVAPMCQYRAEDGSANDWHLMHLGQFSMGAGGLVFTEATHVSPEGRITPKCLGLWSDDNERTLKRVVRSEEHTSELQSLMRISYAVFCLKKNKL